MNLDDHSFSSRACRTLSKLLFVATVLLLFLGGMVTSLDVGLSVPDWPTSFGYQMWNLPFRLWMEGAFYEHSHRVYASIIGCITLLVTVWVIARERRPKVRYLAAFALLVVVIQGVLGGLTVRLMLPLPVSVMHGVLAQLFLVLTVMLAYSQSKELGARPTARAADPALRRAVAAFFALVFVQLVLGAIMRHGMKHIGGVAIHDFPTVAGQWIPILNAETVARINAFRDSLSGTDQPMAAHVSMVHVVMHLIHRVGAAVVVIGAVVLTRRAHRLAPAGAKVLEGVYLLDSLLVVQIMLGILTVWTQKGEIITSVHVANGALLLSAATLLALRTWPMQWMRPGTSPSV